LPVFVCVFGWIFRISADADPDETLLRVEADLGEGRRKLLLFIQNGKI